MKISDISIVIPTKDRPGDLKKCIESLVVQKEVFPKEVIVVDSSEMDAQLDLSVYKKAAFPIIRIQSRPSVTVQRNIGIKAAGGGIIGFLDDDCVVADNYIESLEAAYRALPDAGGIHGVIPNSDKRTFLKKLFSTLFSLPEIDGTGRLKRSGAVSMLDQNLFKKQNKPLRTELMGGCATYKSAIFKEEGFLFDESFAGNLCEDTEFSYRVSRKFNLYIAPDVRVYHFPSPVLRSRESYYYQRMVSVYKCWKKAGRDSDPINYLAFGLYSAGTFFQALRACVKNWNPGPFNGWFEGILNIFKVADESTMPKRKKQITVVFVAALLCAAILLLNNLILVALIFFLWLILYLVRRGFIMGGLFLLIIYMPFDAFVLSHVPPSIFLYAKYLSTVAVFAISMIIILRSYKRFDLLRAVPGILFLILYVLSGVISAVINKINLYVVMTSLQQELRYVPLFIGLAVTNLDIGYIKKAVKAILVIGMINVLIGLVQLCAGKFVTPLLLQKSVMLEGELLAVGTVQVLQRTGLIFGVFPSYNVFGAYLTIIFLLLVALNRYGIFKMGLLKKAGIPVFVILIFTLSRSSIIGACAGYLALLFASKSKKSIFIIVFFVLIMVFMAMIGFEANIFSSNPQELTIVPRILEAFSPEGWRTSAMYGRTALMSLTIKTLSSSGSFPFGLGPGNWGSLLAWKYSPVYNAIAETSQASVLDRMILADVNWASILGQFGIIGTLFFTLFIVTLIKYCLSIIGSQKTVDPVLRSIALATFGIFIAISIESFFGSWFAARSISFHMWLLAGFVVSFNNSENRKKSLEAEG